MRAFARMKVQPGHKTTSMGYFFIRKAATQLNYVENSGASVEANRALPPTYNRNKMKPFIGD